MSIVATVAHLTYELLLAFIAVPVPSLAKGGGKFFNTQYSQAGILYYYTLLQMLDVLQMFSLLTT